MTRLGKSIDRFLADESGNETLEWGLVCSLLVLVAVTAFAMMGPRVTEMWNDVNNEIGIAE